MRQVAAIAGLGAETVVDLVKVSLDMPRSERSLGRRERLGMISLTALAAGIPGWIIVGPAGFVLGATSVAVLLHWRYRARQSTGRDVLQRSIPEVVGLLAVAASAGLNPHRSLKVISEITEGPIAEVLNRAYSLASAGSTTAEALSLAADEFDLDELRSIGRAFGAAERQGSAVAPALRRLGRDIGERRRRNAEARARRAPVRVLFPLVTCVLPAFVLMAVVPVVADTFTAIRS